MSGSDYTLSESFREGCWIRPRKRLPTPKPKLQVESLRDPYEDEIRRGMDGRKIKEGFIQSFAIKLSTHYYNKVRKTSGCSFAKAKSAFPLHVRRFVSPTILHTTLQTFDFITTNYSLTRAKMSPIVSRCCKWQWFLSPIFALPIL